MIVPTHLDEKRARLYRQQGWWADETIGGRFKSTAQAHPEAVAVIDGLRLTYAEIDRAAASLASALQARGIAAGDVMSFQLPNWWESAVVLVAAAKLGAVCNPLQMIYRQRELRFILRQSASKVIFAPGQFRGTDYTAMASEVGGQLDPRPLVITVRGDGRNNFEEVLATESEPTPTAISPDDVCLLLYTSGTTAEPKGVLHTHNTLLRAGQDLVDLFRYEAADRIFMPSPVTHVTGLLLGFIAPWAVGASTVLMDHWEAEKALDAVLELGCTFTGGATPFLRGLIEATRGRGLGADDIPLRRGPCGGADVPPSVIYDAAEVLGARFTRIYGSTEGVTVTGTPLDAAFRKAAETDGQPLPGHELRIVDESGRDVSPGVAGEILVRGPSNFLGYFDPALNADTFEPGSFIRMGDLGVWDEEGSIRIQGRKKDIIIRNGENISAKEVEDLLVTHPAIQEVAIVGVPDRDTGERACAYLVARQLPAPSLQDLRSFLAAAQIARQKFPEYVIVVDELPKTASGKIQKFKLREDARGRQLRLERPISR